MVSQSVTTQAENDKRLLCLYIRIRWLRIYIVIADTRDNGLQSFVLQLYNRVIICLLTFIW